MVKTWSLKPTFDHFTQSKQTVESKQRENDGKTKQNFSPKRPKFDRYYLNDAKKAIYIWKTTIYQNKILLQAKQCLLPVILQ